MQYLICNKTCIGKVSSSVMKAISRVGLVWATQLFTIFGKKAKPLRLTSFLTITVFLGNSNSYPVNISLERMCQQCRKEMH